MSKKSVDPNSDSPLLGELFLQVAQDVRRGFRQQLEPWGLAPHQVRALRTIDRDGPMRLGVLAEQLAIAPRSVTDVAEQLEQRGMVKRHPDPDDGRAVVVAVTAKGSSTIAAIETARRGAADAYFARLNDADRAALTRVLGVLRSS